MKVYKIKVNGKAYRVELEAVEENNAAAPAAPKAEAPKEAQPKVVAAGPIQGQEVLSPIQGQVTKVLVKPGDKVTKGTVLCVIEAMKLENDVVSPYDGEVIEVLVSKGSNVASKERIAVIR